MKQKGKEFIQLFILYFKAYIKEIIFYVLAASIFFLVFSLYGLPLEPVIYSFILCMNIGVVFLSVNFMDYYRRHKILKDLQDSIVLSLEKLPDVKDMIEQDYQELLSILYNANVQSKYEADEKYNNLMRYYTLWAHQIKTPIAAIHLILQEEENEQNLELSMELFKIEQYVEFVLQYLRLDSMFSDLVFKKYSLDEIVKQAVRKYARMFVRKKIKLDFKGLNCEVLTDEKWLCFVIEQILSNALKYTKQGMIFIYMHPDFEKTLVIEDTGIGIAKEDLNRIFERGFTGYNGRWDKKSTGLGLYLCKQILDRLSHRITIESELDQGTKVFIHLETIQLKAE
ncbi:sensor histidine kinase [Defluviitalea raffinosedens]|uniref:sensor histidine kinase n=1 Tax=Defluviitalea raffinosedens TaxID=1450156 RepID=UPI0019572C8C|nr:sensor histidine kinase [Defluviitalea raffinosedens]MBM7684712.1 signal transduction histidine kinase [Defluviitalea raffinosedens]